MGLTTAVGGTEGGRWRGMARNLQGQGEEKRRWELVIVEVWAKNWIDGKKGGIGKQRVGKWELGMDYGNM